MAMLVTMCITIIYLIHPPTSSISHTHTMIALTLTVGDAREVHDVHEIRKRTFSNWGYFKCMVGETTQPSVLVPIFGR